VVKNIIINSFELNAQTDIIYNNFAKAFDQVNHAILVRKLQIFGFSGSGTKLVSMIHIWTSPNR